MSLPYADRSSSVSVDPTLADTGEVLDLEVD